jgi:hypothetical protein
MSGKAGPRLGRSNARALPTYAQQRFGGLPGFRPGAMAPSPELFRLVRQVAQRSGAAQAWMTAGRLAFAFDEGPRRVQALLFGSSVSFHKGCRMGRSKRPCSRQPSAF